MAWHKYIKTEKNWNKLVKHREPKVEQYSLRRLVSGTHTISISHIEDLGASERSPISLTCILFTDCKGGGTGICLHLYTSTSGWNERGERAGDNMVISMSASGISQRTCGYLLIKFPAAAVSDLSAFIHYFSLVDSWFHPSIAQSAHSHCSSYTVEHAGINCLTSGYWLTHSARNNASWEESGSLPYEQWVQTERFLSFSNQSATVCNLSPNWLILDLENVMSHVFK